MGHRDEFEGTETLTHARRLALPSCLGPTTEALGHDALAVANPFVVSAYS